MSPPCHTFSDQFFRATWGGHLQAVVPKENRAHSSATNAFYFCPWLPPPHPSICVINFQVLSMPSPPLSLIPQLTSPVHSHVLPWALPSFSQATTDLKRPSGSASPSPSQAGAGLPCDPLPLLRLWKQINISWMNGQALNPPLPQTPIYLLKRPSFFKYQSFAFSQVHVPLWRLTSQIMRIFVLLPPWAATLGCIRGEAAQVRD